MISETVAASLLALRLLLLKIPWQARLTATISICCAVSVSIAFQVGLHWASSSPVETCTEAKAEPGAVHLHGTAMSCPQVDSFPVMLTEPEESPVCDEFAREFCGCSDPNTWAGDDAKIVSAWSWKKRPELAMKAGEDEDEMIAIERAWVTELEQLRHFLERYTPLQQRYEKHLSADIVVAINQNSGTNRVSSTEPMWCSTDDAYSISAHRPLLSLIVPSDMQQAYDDTHSRFCAVHRSFSRAALWIFSTPWDLFSPDFPALTCGLARVQWNNIKAMNRWMAALKNCENEPNYDDKEAATQGGF